MDIVDHAVDTLNRAIESDRKAISELICLRVNCNEELAKDKTIQVFCEDNNAFMVGALGLINGILGIEDGHGPIVAVFSKEGSLVGFKRMMFVTVDN